MKHTSLVTALLISCLTALAVAQQQPAAPAAGRGAAGRGAAPQAAPAPGSPAVYKSDAELMATLQSAVARAGAGGTGMSSSPFSTTDQYSINVVRRDKGAGAISHAGNTEVHHIIEGAATFVTGGKIVRPAATGGTATIEGGVSRRVTKGDVILIPADTPHWYKDVEGSITYLEVRFVVPVK